MIWAETVHSDEGPSGVDGWADEGSAGEAAWVGTEAGGSFGTPDRASIVGFCAAVGIGDDKAASDWLNC